MASALRGSAPGTSSAAERFRIEPLSGYQDDAEGRIDENLAWQKIVSLVTDRFSRELPLLVDTLK